MKKFLFTAAAIVCAVLMTVNLTSCGKEDNEPISAIYSTECKINEETHSVSANPEAMAQADANYQALKSELTNILSIDSWTVNFNNNNRNEVLNREDQNAKKKFDEMMAKVNAFKAKLDNLDKTQPKNQFNWNFSADVTTKRSGYNIDKTIATQKVTINYGGNN